MIKSDAPVMQSFFQPAEIEVSNERRNALRGKGQALYGKYCGTGGHGICAESFAEYHIWRGEYVAARDLLSYLNEQVVHLNQISPMTDENRNQLVMTERLIGRIEALLGVEV